MKSVMAVFVVVLALGVLTRAMHIHPHHNSLGDADVILTDDAPPTVATDDTSIDTKNLNAARFVPLNNAFFFKLNSPCEYGYQRDFLGICREVW